jgi:hypothetical protein
MKNNGDKVFAFPANNYNFNEFRSQTSHNTRHFNQINENTPARIHTEGLNYNSTLYKGKKFAYN